MNISPEQVHELPPRIRTEFLDAFVNALQPVFLVGAALTLVAFVLSFFLTEVPLRARNRASSELAAEEAAAGGTGAEEFVTEDVL